jgi:glutathione S-transferase
MKLYMHPASTTCRPIMFFAAESGIALEEVVVDILSGEQYGAAYSAVNPNNTVPVLEDGDFRVKESSAILKYLAEKTGSPAYPTELKARTRVNEAMDWFNTGFYRSFGYNLCYAQILDPYKLPDAKAQQLALEAGRRGAERYLAVLNDHMIGPQGKYVCGDAMTIADYFGAGLLSLGEAIGCRFSAYPNVQRWYQSISSRPKWRETNAGLYGWAEYLRGPQYVTV